MLLDVLLFFPFLVLSVRARRQPSLTIGREDSPTDGALNALMREFFEARDPVDPSVRGLVKYLDPGDQVTILRCANANMRWTDKKTGQDDLRVRQCRSFWCAWCIRLAHWRRTRYQYLKLQSIQPKDDDQVRLLHLVVELPQPLHALVREDDDALTAWRNAVKATIADAYGYKGRKARTASESCWSEMGAIFNFHAIGDEGMPWPKFFPHFDILLSAYHCTNGTIEPLRTDWPEPFRVTRSRYREHLRNAFLPIAKEQQNAELEAFVSTSFPVIWHVSRAPQGAGEGRVHIRNAAHRIRYSCRPLFGLDRCRLRVGEDGETLLYEPMGKRKVPLIHEVKPGPAFGALRSLKDKLGGKHSRFIVGTLAGKAYTRVTSIAGRPEVKERVKSDKVLVGAYLRQEDGSFKFVDPRDVGRL